MTRVNTIPVELLLDQHLLAEYRELPMVLASLKRSLVAVNGKAKLLKIPPKYTLNTGHVSFFYNKEKWLNQRWKLLIKELKFRGYRIDHKARNVDWSIFNTVPQIDWEPSMADKLLNFERIVTRFQQRPAWYRFHGSPIPPGVYANKALKVLGE